MFTKTSRATRVLQSICTTRTRLLARNCLFGPTSPSATPGWSRCCSWKSASLTRPTIPSWPACNGSKCQPSKFKFLFAVPNASWSVSSRTLPPAPAGFTTPNNMSSNPTPTAPFTLAAEVEYLLQTKEDYLASSRSSAALSVLTTLYEELESFWQDLTTPTEEQLLQYALLNLEQKKASWKTSFESDKDDLQRSEKRLEHLLQQQKLTLSQLVVQLTQKYNSEWRHSGRLIEQQQQQLAQKKKSWDARKQALVQSYLDDLTSRRQKLT